MARPLPSCGGWWSVGGRKSTRQRRKEGREGGRERAPQQQPPPPPLAHVRHVYRYAASRSVVVRRLGLVVRRLACVRRSCCCSPSARLAVAADATHPTNRQNRHPNQLGAYSGHAHWPPTPPVARFESLLACSSAELARSPASAAPSPPPGGVPPEFASVHSSRSSPCRLLFRLR